MDVLAAGLVLDERERVVELADVVVVGRDAGDERVGTDGFRGSLGEIADHERVVVRARRLVSRRRSSGWDGFASSSSWKTVRIPKRMPRAAKQPTATTAAPAADATDAPHNSSTPLTSRSPRRRRRRDDGDVDERDREAGLDEHVQTVAATDADDPGQTAQQDVGRELERTAVDRAGEDRETP